MPKSMKCVHLQGCHMAKKGDERKIKNDTVACILYNCILSNSILLQEWQIQARQGKSAVTFTTQLHPAACGFRDMHFCLLRIFITWR